jgi:hypothetical protein
MAEQFFGTLIASALGAFLAAWLGFRYALRKVQAERAFDRRLEWYENAVRRLLETATKLHWTFAADEAKLSAVQMERVLAESYEAVAALRALQVEAELYATNATYAAIEEAVADATHVSHAAVAFRYMEDATPPGRLLQITCKILYHAASRLATDVRDHLRLEVIEREWRLYDKELRELHAELNALRVTDDSVESSQTSVGDKS